MQGQSKISSQFWRDLNNIEAHTKNTGKKHKYINYGAKKLISGEFWTDIHTQIPWVS